jgi:hypothetical protein
MCWTKPPPSCGLVHIRFMDDILILAPTRWHLRRAVKAVNQTLGALSLEKHPDNTFIGTRVRLPRLSFLSGWSGCGQADSHKLHPEGISAL